MAAVGCIDPKTNHNNNINQPKINFAFADRLKPTCSQRSSMSSPSSSSLGHDSDSSNNLDSSWSRNNLYLRAERSRNNPHGSPTQYRAKAIIRKYRRHVRQVEFKRMRSIVPAVAGNEKASQVSRLFYICHMLHSIVVLWDSIKFIFCFKAKCSYVHPRYNYSCACDSILSTFF